MARAFVAVVPPEPVLDAVEDVAERLAVTLPSTARRTRREQWHLTLQFLGDHADLGTVAGALDALALREGRVALGGLGAFGSARRARVVWLGVREGDEWLAQAAAAVGALVAPLGHEPEHERFHPHLTLARLRAPTDVRDVLAQAGDPADTVGEVFTVGEIVLFESTQGAGGARHRSHARFLLGSAWGM
jgi:RNA 2',3'-cyclic 3'-phosphodiesterase